MDILLIVLGLAGLIAGGDLLVRHAVALAERLNVSPMVIGLTLVGFGTSTPELVTSLQAASVGAPGIAMGNVIGSNIANILLIIGIAALLKPISVAPDALRRDGTVMLAAAGLALGIVLIGAASRGAGAGLVCALVAYLVWTLRAERDRNSATAEIYKNEASLVSPPSAPLWRSLALLVAGLVVTLVAARALVAGAVSFATIMGISETVIGLTIVAVGTSMPELITSVIAARRGQSDVALGNIIGSNIFNILGILGLTALFIPIPVPASLARFDIWVMLAATAALVILARSGWRIDRREGGILLAGYGIYTGVLLAAAL